MVESISVTPRRRIKRISPPLSTAGSAAATQHAYSRYGRYKVRESPRLDLDQDLRAHRDRPPCPEGYSTECPLWVTSGRRSPDCKWSAIGPGADIGPRYVCFEG